ncbi:hypothetical protein LWI29_012347 [Acer saccharum]|uniref:YqgF/RNase H-like domain-containing protein n=1 Tax=Acer saccharum TaxID=4024 RepID=A0AA39VFY4_ACESA|nr:hypothetical protein LWI29_012347 [Acer saccharum]
MKYLRPVNFYEEIFKEILKKEDHLKPGRLLGLAVSDKYVSLAVSDWKNKTAVPLRAVDRQEINMSSMADMIQSLIPEHNLVGFIVGSTYPRPMDAQIKKFIDDLRKTGKVKDLTYTFWDYGITSKDAEFVFDQHLKYVLESLNQPLDKSKIIMEKCYAISALQGYLDCTNKMVKEDWDGYCTNPSSWLQVDAKKSSQEDWDGYCTDPSSWLHVDAKKCLQEDGVGYYTDTSSWLMVKAPTTSTQPIGDDITSSLYASCGRF